MRKSTSVVRTLRTFLLFVTPLACLMADGSSRRCSAPVACPGFLEAAQTEKVLTGSPSFQHSKAHVQDTYGRLPLSFEVNQGQTDPQV